MTVLMRMAIEFESGIRGFTAWRVWEVAWLEFSGHLCEQLAALGCHFPSAQTGITFGA